MPSSWQILPDPLSADVYDSVASAHVPDTARADTNEQFGFGMLYPLRLNVQGDFSADSGARLIRSAVILVLTTICRAGGDTLGELPWRTEFGSILPLVRLRNNDATMENNVKGFVIEALQRWITSIRVTEVILVPGNRYKLHCKVVYDIVDSGGARVLIPGIQTAVPVG